MENILPNGDFSEDLCLWHSNGCHAFVAVEGSGYHNGIKPHSGSRYAVVTHRTQTWQGLEQVLQNISAGTEYIVIAYVRVHGEFHEPVGVQATLKLEGEGSPTNYHSVARYFDSKVLFIALYDAISVPFVYQGKLFDQDFGLTRMLGEVGRFV